MKRNRLLKTAVCLFVSILMLLTALPAGASPNEAQSDNAVSFISDKTSAQKETEFTADSMAADSTSSDNTTADSAPSDSTTADSIPSSGKTADSVASGDSAKESTSSDQNLLSESALTATDAQLSNGYYTIASDLGNSMYMSVAGASTEDKASIVLGKADGSESQIFYVASLGNGLYSIRNMNSGKMLDAQGAGTSDMTNVWQYASNSTPAQEWYVQDAGNGLCTIKAGYCDKVLDVEWGSANAGANIQLYTSNSTPAQKWSFTKVTVTLSEGVYTISSALSSSKVLDVAGGSISDGAALQLYGSNGTVAQKFIVTALGGDWYSIRNLYSRKALDVTGGSTLSGTKVQLYTDNGTDAQKWKIVMQEDGTYSVIGTSGKALDVKNGSAFDGAGIQIYDSNGTAAQRWNFVPTDATVSTQGIIRISTALDNSKNLDVVDGNWDNGTNVQIHTGGNTASRSNQQFTLVSDGSGWYTIMNVATGKVLDVAGGSNKDGANVQLYEPNGTAAQKWQLVSSKAGDGSFYIVSALGRYLDIAAAGTANGTNVQIYTGNGTAAQRFYMTADAFNGKGWYSTAPTIRSYYVDGSAVKGWQKLSYYWYYFDSNGMMVTSSVVGTNRLLDSGRMAPLTTVFENVQPGQKTVKSLLQTAMTAVGRTLYIWGGGWDSSDTQKIGYLKSWENFFTLHGDTSYIRQNYENSYGSGLDCSGFMAWVVYNTVYTKNGQINLLEENGTSYNSTLLAKRLSELKWAYLGKSSTTAAFHPGDVVSMSGHVYMVIGVCSDGSVVIVHSSPAGSPNGGGVQISGTVNNAGSTNSEAYRLAKQYMDKYFFEWPFGTACVGTAYTKDYVNFANWNTLSGTISDPDGITNMTAAQVLKNLFGE